MGTFYKYLIYGHFPKINITYQRTPGTTYKHLIYGHFPKITITYQGTPGTTHKYLIYGHFSKINISFHGSLGSIWSLWLDIRNFLKKRNASHLDLLAPQQVNTANIQSWSLWHKYDDSI